MILNYIYCFVSNICVYVCSQNMNHLYQLVQSEYLRWLALCYCPVQSKNEIFMNHICIKVVNSVHSVVLKYYCELNFLHIVNLYGRNDRRSLEKRKVAGSNNHVDILTDGVHSIMIHLVTLMEELKRLESSAHVSSSLVHKGRQSKEDSLKMFALKFNEFKIKLRNANGLISKLDIDLRKQITAISSISLMESNNEKSTQEHISGTPICANAFELTGKSDFSVHGEHEVFIGTSCNDTNMVTEAGEEYVFERRQLMPNVLSELKTALRPVYEMHIERERQALLRTGRSYLETVAEEESSVNTSECSSGVKEADETNTPRLTNVEGTKAVLDNPCSNLVTLCSTCNPYESEKNVSTTKYATANSNVSLSSDFPVNMNISGSFSCPTGVFNETHHYTEAAGDIINKCENNMSTSNSVGTSRIVSTNRVCVLDSIISKSVVKTDVTEANTAVGTESCIPKSPVTAIVEPTLTANKYSYSVVNSCESTIRLPNSTTAPIVSVNHYPILNVMPSSKIVLKNVGDNSKKNEIRETLLSGIVNLQTFSKPKALVEEQFIYDGDSDNESSD